MNQMLVLLLYVMPLLGKTKINMEQKFKEHKVLITGVSSGLGYGLAQAYLERGIKVLGCSRRTPEALIQQGLNFCALDFSDRVSSLPILNHWISEVGSIDLLILNAGVLGSIKDMQASTTEELKATMEVNLWANKWFLDICLSRCGLIRQVVGISSGASLSGSRGWNGYSLSKAAFNMLIKLYSSECPNTHFAALAPGLIDTAMQDYLTNLPADERYSPLEVLKKAKGTDAMPNGYECAQKLISIFPKLLNFQSGGYYDIRKLD